MTVSLSTMWWGEPSPESLVSLAQRTRSLGFEQVELNYRLPAGALPSLRVALRQAGLSVSSVHAPFPRPAGARPLSQLDLASPQGELRKRAEALALRSLEEAARWGAGVVALHAGDLSALRPMETQLHDLYEECRSGAGESAAEEAYRRLQSELEDRRNTEAPGHLERVHDALGRLVERGRALGVIIGLENRAYYAEVPALDEMGVLLDEFGPAVGYWHDVGHAFRLEALGFWPQEAWLQRFAARLVGVHLHDSIGMEDHRPPGQGHAPFGLISSFLPAQCLRVVEVKDAYSGEAVGAGLAHLRALGVLP